MIKVATRAHLYLLLVTVFWGLTFPLIKNAMSFIGPNLFVSLRFTLAALFFIPFVWKQITKINYTVLIGGIILGILNAGLYITQTIGLQTTSSANAAFISAISVALIPFFMPLFRIGKLTWTNITCSLIALYGIFILTGGHFDHFHTGDAWVLACAFFSALAVTYLHVIASRVRSFLPLAFLQTLMVIPIAFIFAHHEPSLQIMHPTVLIALVFCSLFATCFVYYYQCKYQPKTTPAKAALIYALEPVFATIFAYFINHERITLHIIAGGAIILLALILSECLTLMNDNTSEQRKDVPRPG